MSLLQDCKFFELLVIAGTVVLLALLVMEVLDITHFFPFYDRKECVYGYGQINGPYMWKYKFPLSTGHQQSPIEIVTDCAVCVPVETTICLDFSSEYYKPPKEMTLSNDGHTASIYATWDDGRRPAISGGPLNEVYNFFMLTFRWGPTNIEGSEHTINNTRYAMEAQAVHVKADINFDTVSKAAAACGLVIISYFYEITARDNPYMEPIINALRQTRCAFSKTSMEPTPLCWIMPPFDSKYFFYHGSLTYPPCTEGVKWIVQPEPIGISVRQLKQFRKLMKVDGTLIDINTRPVQGVNTRDIFYYD